MTASEWQKRYMEPLLAVAHSNRRPSDELESGFAGFILDGVLAVKEIDGQELTDWECVEAVEELVRYARLTEGRFR